MDDDLPGAGSAQLLAESPTSPSPVRPAPRGDYRQRGLDLPGRPASPVLGRQRRRPRMRRLRRSLVRWAVVAMVGAGSALSLRLFVLEAFAVPSNLMAPTLQTGDRIIAIRASVVHQVHRGEIVVFRPPKLFPCGTGGAPGTDLVERVVGLPGETISSSHGNVDIDGNRLEEQGWYDRAYGPLGSDPIASTTIPRGDFFVMGDNRDDTCDSRVFGPIPRALIIGKVLLVLTRDGHPHFELF